MKSVIYFVLIVMASASESFAKPAPNFELIFKEIKEARTATESIRVREKYLVQMRNLRDFDRLSDLEELNEGEEYFDHYRKMLSKFTLNNVGRYMLNKHSDEEQDVFARNITSKAFGSYDLNKILSKGLYYVEDCEDYQSYLEMSRAPSSFSSAHQAHYCFGNQGGGFGNTFEIISDVTLAEGDYKTIFLPSTLYVKKLFISVEGYAGDAYFDVMVNGDIKGTIYAPGRDPLYIINVSDSTHSIQLRSMVGSALISSIKAEVR